MASYSKSPPINPNRSHYAPPPTLVSRRGTSGRTGSTNQLRIIGGQWRGRKLNFPDIDGLRPTGDRIRETLFNWLTGDLPASRCLDLFAGAGSLGLEALSRGASQVVLLEKHPQAASQLQAHLSTLNCSQGQAVQTDSLQWLANHQGEGFDIVFMDPPFKQTSGKQPLPSCATNNYLILVPPSILKPP